MLSTIGGHITTQIGVIFDDRTRAATINVVYEY